jgi:hypothetical protein
MRHLAHALTAVALFAAASTAESQSLNGLYLQNQSLGRGNVWHYYYFWPDGRMCNVMPKGGMNPVPTYAAVSAANPGQCGTFSLRGSALQLQTDGGSKPVTLKLDHVDNGGFALSGFPTIRVPAFADGATLNGTWKTLVINGSDYRTQSYTFQPEGGFTFDDVPVRAAGAPARHIAGTYRLSGNTLRISSTGGAQVLSIHGFPSDTRISVDGNVIEKK